MKKGKKLVVNILLLVTIILLMPRSAEASYDPGSMGVGYYVDLDAYKSVVWYNRITTNVYYNGKIVGTTEIDIGMTRAKSKSGSYYIDSFLTRISSKGKGSDSIYGYTDFIQLSSTLNEKQILWAHDPKEAAGSTSYTVGMNVGGNVNNDGKGGINLGISASHTFTKKALDIIDNSDPSSRYFCVKFDYNHALWRWDWNTLNKYAYDYSDQLASYEIKTTSSKYTYKMVLDVKYEIYNNVPSYWANPRMKYAEAKKTIIFTSAY